MEEPTVQYLQVTEADEVQEDQGVETTQEVQTTERTETAAAALQDLRFTENGQFEIFKMLCDLTSDINGF